MKHIKSYSAIFESESGEVSHTPESIKQMPEYHDLVNNYGLTDTTSRIMSSRGNLRFEDKEASRAYMIYANGTIRYQNLEVRIWSRRADDGLPAMGKGSPGIYVSPRGEKLGDIIYGQPIKSQEDYKIKFQYLKSLRIKQMGNQEPHLDIEFINKRIDDVINSDPELSKLPAIKRLIKRGIYNPDKSIRTLIKAADLGIF
jgi:hypothetical protein